MRRSIALCEPNHTTASTVGNWKFCYTSANIIPKNAKLKFDLMTHGRAMEWEVPSTNIKGKSNLIWAVLPNGKTLAAKALEDPVSFAISFEFTLPSEIKAGETFTIILGSPEKDKEKQKKLGNRCQKTLQRRRPFTLYIDPKGKNDYKESEVFTMDVRGNVLSNIRIIAPSLVAKNKRFDVMVRFEDEYGNLTSNAPEGTLIELSYENLRENLNWKLFVPETGFISLPNLYFNEPGIYRIQLKNARTKELFFSPPIKCLAESENSIFWGLLHGESEKIDSLEHIEACLRTFRDEQALQFFSTSPFEATEEVSAEEWKQMATHVATFNEEGRFTTFLGFQYVGASGEEGVRELIWSKDSKPLCRRKEAKTSHLKKVYKSASAKDLLSIYAFTMASGYECDFTDITPEYERLAEIYNAWGSSECSAKEGNLRPIAIDGKKGIKETEKGSLKKALRRNVRFGFVAGGLDDRGIYSPLFESDQKQYSPGLTAIIAPEHNREALFQALYNRSCYATTGERIILDFSIAGASMGSELSTKNKPGLAINRHITGYVAGTKPLKEVTIFRNGEKLHTLHPKSSHCEFAWDDLSPLAKCALSSPDDRPPFAYYYLRAVQEDGHIAWGSPIWIDVMDPAPAEEKKPKKKTR